MFGISDELVLTFEGAVVLLRPANNWRTRSLAALPYYAPLSGSLRRRAAYKPNLN